MAELIQSRNGLSSIIEFCGKVIYEIWEEGDDLNNVVLKKLGPIIDKKTLLEESIIDASKLEPVLYLFEDWELHERGWLITGYTNKRVIHYLSHLGPSQFYPREEIKLFKKKCRFRRWRGKPLIRGHIFRSEEDNEEEDKNKPVELKETDVFSK